MKKQLQVLHVNFELNRFPATSDQSLQAWDAADEYLIQEVYDRAKQFKRVLIVNDAFGALSIALLKINPNISISTINNSYLSQQGLLNNLSANNLNYDNHFDSINQLSGEYDCVLLKVQKSLAQLEDQLHQIRPFINKQTTIIAGGMVKMIHTSTTKLFENILGTCTTSLAKKKARLIYCELNTDLKPPLNPFPSSYTLPNGYELISHAGVFSQKGLDIGTRFLLDNLPSDNKYQKIVDLACGNGVLGICTALHNPHAGIYFCDESYSAIKSAKENFKTLLNDRRSAEFVVDDGLTQYEKQDVDLVISNPPFHQQNTIDNKTAINMFKQSYKILKPGGEILIVGNRHLGYHKKLEIIFGNYHLITSNKKFVILKATKN